MPYLARLLIALGLLLGTVLRLEAQTTAFAYRGQLSDSTRPANGYYELQVRLADAAAGGNYVGPTLALAPVTVSNGCFSVMLDFGAAVFNGAARWVELGVRTNGAASYTVLAPRQQILPLPYAIFSGNAASVSGPVAASQLTGVLSAGQLPGYVLTNGMLQASNIVGQLSSNQIASVSAGQIRGTITNQIPGVYNIRDYGAVGRDTARDSYALGVAFALAYSNVGALYVPPGNYFVTNTLNFNPPYPGRFPFKGAGMGVSTLTFYGVNSTLLTNYVQLDMEDISLVNGDVNQTNNGIVIRGDTGAAYLKNVSFSYFAGVGADFSGAAGMDIVGCWFYANHIGLKLPGYCDGANVEARVDFNDVAVDVGGADTSGFFAGLPPVNGCRLHLMGTRNIYGVVVGAGGSAPIDITGYMEQCFSAILAIGHPADFYPDRSWETNAYRRHINCRLGYDGLMGIPCAYNTATGIGASGTRPGGWLHGQNLSGTMTNYCVLYVPTFDATISANNATTYSKNPASDASSIRYTYSRGWYITSSGVSVRLDANAYSHGYGEDGYADCDINPPTRNGYLVNTAGSQIIPLSGLTANVSAGNVTLYITNGLIMKAQ